MDEIVAVFNCKAKVTRLKLLSWIHLTALFLEYILAGWLLSACKATWFTWAGTQAVTLHLAMVGFDAVALAVAWIIGIVWAGAFSKAWPRSVPWAGVTVWATAWALIWILGLALVLTLAKAETAMKSIGLGKTQAFWVLMIITWVGLGLGRIVDSLFLPNLNYQFP